MLAGDLLSPHSTLVCTVLVIDDEAALRSFAEALLQELGYAVVLAESGRAAVQLLLQDPAAIDAVLLDMTMPGMRPEETFRQLTEIRPGLPVIILSGDPENTVRKRFGPGTIAGYVQKPYTDREVENALAQALAQALARPVLSNSNEFKLVRLSKREIDEAKRDYLVTRTLELPKIADLLTANDFYSVQLAGHSLKGSGGCFGLPEITLIGAKLEICAETFDTAACLEQINALKDCLKQLCAEN